MLVPNDVRYRGVPLYISAMQSVFKGLIFFLFAVVLMSQSTTFIVLVAALLTFTIPYCLANNVYCVTPSISSCSSCPPDSVKCTTLSEYAQEAVSYFTSNTTLEFLPGGHALDKNITLTNIYKLTMHGKSSSGDVATIVCHGEVGLSFTNMVKFKID